MFFDIPLGLILTILNTLFWFHKSGLVVEDSNGRYDILNTEIIHHSCRRMEHQIWTKKIDDERWMR